jgi:hypothetical protein
MHFLREKLQVMATVYPAASLYYFKRQLLLVLCVKIAYFECRTCYVVPNTIINSTGIQRALKLVLVYSM